jgi:hypothetical protein
MRAVVFLDETRVVQYGSDRVWQLANWASKA